MSEIPPFDPEWLGAEAMAGGRNTMMPKPIADSRAEFDTTFASLKPMLPPPTPAVTAVDIEYRPSLKLRVYTPANAGPGPLPVGLYIHSGGWFSGSLEHEDFLARNFSENSKIILVSPDYRLAPENPYPAGLEDCCAAYEWMHANAAAHNGDATHKFIMGGSAGGNLTAAVALKYAKHAELKPSGLIIACMIACDVKSFPPQYAARYTPEIYADSPAIGRPIMLQALEWYAAPEKDGLASVLLHEDIGKLPPTVVMATQKDPTYQETCWFYEEMTKKGAKAELIEWIGLPHFFWIIPILPKSQEFMRVWNEKLKSLIAGAKK